VDAATSSPSQWIRSLPQEVVSMPRLFSVGIPVVLFVVAGIGWLRAVGWNATQADLPRFVKCSVELVFGAFMIIALFLVFQGFAR
jgi:cytochrome b561